MRVPAETTRSSSEASVVGTLTFTEITEAQALRVARHPDEWSADDLYAYVAEEIVRLNGPQLPCKDTQQTIEGFCSRFTIPVAVRIARAAFEVYGASGRARRSPGAASPRATMSSSPRRSWRRWRDR